MGDESREERRLGLGVGQLGVGGELAGVMGCDGLGHFLFTFFSSFAFSFSASSDCNVFCCFLRFLPLVWRRLSVHGVASGVERCLGALPRLSALITMVLETPGCQHCIFDLIFKFHLQYKLPRFLLIIQFLICSYCIFSSFCHVISQKKLLISLQAISCPVNKIATCQ